MIPYERARRAPRQMRHIPPEYRPYARRVAILILLAAALGAALALAIPPGHHH
jgi:hypothetical protein